MSKVKSVDDLRKLGKAMKKEKEAPAEKEAVEKKEGKECPHCGKIML